MDNLLAMIMNKERALLSQRRSQALFFLFFLLLGTHFHSEKAIAQGSCDGATFGQFLEQAQSLGPQAETLGRQLLACPGDDYRQAAIYWLSFIFAMQQKSANIRDLGQSLPSSGSGNEKIQVLYRTWQGDYSGLANRVRIGQRDYADDPLAIQVLARNLIRFEQYKDGLNIYQQLISLQEGSEVSEVERLYALIWSRDDEAALLRIASLRRFDLTPYLRQSVERAETLMEKLGHPKQGSSEDAEHNTWVSLAGKDWVDLRGYRRRSLETNYYGPLHIQLGAHEFSHPLEIERKKEVSLDLSYSWKILESWQLQTEFGYFTAGDQNVLGRLENFIRIGDSVQLGLGVRREAVARIEKPLVIAELGLLRDTGKIGVSLWKRFILTAALSRDGLEAPFESYQSEVRLGQLITEETTKGIGFFIPVDFSQHPKPASDTVSYPRELKIGLGVRMAYGDGLLWQGSAETRLTTVNRSFYDNPGSFEKLLGASLRVEAKYFVHRSWFVFVEGERSFIEKNPGDLVDEEESLVVLGVALTKQGQAGLTPHRNKERE